MRPSRALIGRRYLLPSAVSIVVVALHIPDASLEAQRREISNFSYNMFGYTHLNREMDSIAYRITRFLENAGYEVCLYPVAAPLLGTKKYHGPFPSGMPRSRQAWPRLAGAALP